jgi:hypothetical protein
MQKFIVPAHSGARVGCGHCASGTTAMTADRLLSWAGLFISFGLVASVIFALI